MIARKGKFEGEQNLKQFICALEIVVDKLLINAMELHGHIASVKNITEPKKCGTFHEDSDASDYEIKQLQRKKDDINLRDKYLVEIFDNHL